MKHLITLFIVFISLLSMGQDVNRPIIYLTGGADIGNFYGPSLGVNVGLFEKYTFGFTYFDHKKKPANKPDDYSSGVTSLFNFWENTARDHLQSYAVTGGVYLPTSSEKTRWHLKAGIVFYSMKRPTNWEKLEGNFITENYLYDIQEKTHLGLLINPTFEIPFYRVFGLSAGPYLLLNKESSSLGFDISFMLGSLR